MRDFREFVTIGFNNLRVYRLRSTLSLIGIIIGITAVVTIASIGEGSKSKIRKELKKMGTELISIFPKPVYFEQSENYSVSVTTDQFPLTKNDLLSIKKNASSVGNITEMIQKGHELGKECVVVWGIDVDFQDIAIVNVLQGRFINRIDIDMRRNICAIEMNRVAQKALKGTPKIGDLVSFGNRSYRIVGLVKREAFWIQRFTEMMDVYVPISVLEEEGSENKGYYAKAVSEDRLSNATYEIETILQSRRLGKKIFKAQSYGEYLKMQNKIIRVVTLVVGGVALLSLLVGSIGIMNVMLVSVGERTREIGIRIALGALRSDILLQFLIEAIILCIAGGIIGIIVGLIIAWIAAPLLQVPFIISWIVVFIGVTFSVFVGILSGLYPAFKASKLDPIEALRYE
ncbi:ABC transporter permease [candidate division WOR-3 bacterium]|nr:ABC transporter permease [candidate division WOR-3 bacterium]